VTAEDVISLCYRHGRILPNRILRELSEQPAPGPAGIKPPAPSGETTPETEKPAPKPEAPAELPDLVTLDQAAAAVHQRKRALEHYKNKGMPDPLVEGGGGRTAKWDWQIIRPWLESQFGIRLPETYPANRRR
jgi:hypothetical protein